MLQKTVCFLSLLALLMGTVNARAKNFVVGSCKSGLPNFTTISAAVAAVPPFSTVFVCPGTYAEQITINQPLTIKGITTNNSASVVIAVPPNGLSANVNSIFVGPAVAQVGITAGPVNIFDITVDGTNNGINGSFWLGGVFYQGGSSGVINRIATRNQTNIGQGVGVWLENGTPNPESITLENSSIHDVDDGVIAGDATLNVIIAGNSILSRNYGIVLEATGSAKNNRVSAGQYGIMHTLGTVSSNIIANSPFGIYANGSGTVDSNNKILSSSSYGIYLNASGATVNSNSITGSNTAIYLTSNGEAVNSNSITFANVAIELACTTDDVISGNVINDAVVGLNDVPSGFSGTNSFFNVGTVSNVCTQNVAK